MVVIRNAYSRVEHSAPKLAEPLVGNTVPRVIRPLGTMLQDVTSFVMRHRMPESRFGDLALGDPAFVRNLRNGREPRAVTAAKVRVFMARWDV